MTFGPLFCPDICCGVAGPFDFYGKAISHASVPTSDNGWVDFLYLVDSVREAGISNPYTSIDKDFFVDYDINPIAHAAEHKAAIVMTIAPWLTTGERCWAIRKQNRWHPDSGISTEKIGSTTDLSAWTKGSDVTISGDELTNTAGSHSGSHTGSNNATSLTDSTQSWTTNELVGQTITNNTDGSSGTITANGTSTVSVTLSGGSDNDWDTNDTYTISAATQKAYIYKTITLAANTNYSFMIVAKPLECTKLRIDISGITTITIDLTAHTGGTAVTQVDQNTYEHRIDFTTGSSTSQKIEIRMITSGSEYDGIDGDRVLIEWVSVRHMGSTAFYDVALCNVASESIINHYLPSNSDEATWSYTFPKTTICDSGSPPTCETQSTWPTAGYDPQELVQLAAKSTRYINADSDYDTIWNTLTGCSISSTQMALFYSDVDTIMYSGADVMLKLSSGSYSVLIGGPCPRVNIEYPVYSNSDLIYLQDSTRLQWWDSSSSSYKYYKYYYAPASHQNNAPIVPLIVGMSPHVYGKGWAYQTARAMVFDGSDDDPWNASSSSNEENWRISEVHSITDTVKVLYGDIIEKDYTYYRYEPNASNLDDWSADIDSTTETVLTVSDVAANVFWSISKTNNRVVKRAVHRYWEEGKIGIGVGILDTYENTADCKLLWADSDGTHHKAIIAYHLTTMVVTDQSGGSSYSTSWKIGDTTNAEPTESFSSEEWKVVVTDETGSTKTATSYSDAATKYRGLCAIGNGKFVYFENLGSGQYKMHVTGPDGWTLSSEAGETSLPDCVAASERHFYVTGFWLKDNRMELISGKRYATNWVFGHKETDNAWPVRHIGAGASGYDQSSNLLDSSGLLTHDSIKNSSALDLVPEQNRYPDRIP